MDRGPQQHSALPTPHSALPLRLGCTSYVIPAEILPNVEMMAPLVDDIELVLFESPEMSNLPSPVDIDALASLGTQHNTTFTVHLPTDRKAGSESDAERAEMCASHCRIIERFSHLNPYGYLLHFEGIRPGAETSEVAAWRVRCREVASSILRDSGVDPRLLCVECLSYPWHWHQEIVQDLGLSTCIDVGHLWLYRIDSWIRESEEMLPACRIVHLHGVSGRTDHVSLAKSDPELVRYFLGILARAKYPHVLTLEVFNETDTFESINVVRDTWARSSW